LNKRKKVVVVVLSITTTVAVPRRATPRLQATEKPLTRFVAS
jgi:hypothetical protein